MVLEITNTSGYEMDFEKEDIIERFSRGDKARTSEGNGLGLANRKYLCESTGRRI